MDQVHERTSCLLLSVVNLSCRADVAGRFSFHTCNLRNLPADCGLT